MRGFFFLVQSKDSSALYTVSTLRAISSKVKASSMPEASVAVELAKALS